MTWGVACRALRRYGEAETHYRAAISLDPSFAIAHANLGNVLDLLEKTEDAEQALRQAVSLNPETPDAQYNLACVLTKLERPDQALPLFQSLSAVAPERWDVLTNLGVTLLALGELDEAEAILLKALDIAPDNPEAHYNLAWILLLTDRHVEGWTELEWRWRLPEFSSEKASYPMPSWDGDHRPQTTVLLHAGQGFGDTIHFVRFAAEARQRCARTILQCQEPLVRLLQGLEGVDEVVTSDADPPKADVQLPLLSLPRVLAFDGSNTPKAEGYIPVPNVIENRLRLPDSQVRRIGLGRVAGQ